MTDGVRDIVSGGIALLAAAALLRGLGERATRITAREALNGGSLSATVEPRGALGLLAGRATRVYVRGAANSIDGVPFTAEQSTRSPGIADRLVIDLRDVRVAGIDVRRLRASIPRVAFDPVSALSGHVRLTGAGTGTFEAEIPLGSIAVFLQRRFASISGASIGAEGGYITLSADIDMMGSPVPFTARGRPVVRAGRFIEIMEPQLTLSGASVPDILAGSMLSALTPILDLESDLHAGGWLRLQSVSNGDGTVRIGATARLPVRGDLGRRRDGE